MTVDKKKIFEKELKGEPIAKDMFGQYVLEGDIIAYGVSVNQKATVKVGKVLKIIERVSHNNRKFLKIKLVRAERDRFHNWSKGRKPSYIENLDNMIKLDVKTFPKRILILLEEQMDIKE